MSFRWAHFCGFCLGHLFVFHLLFSCCCCLALCEPCYFPCGGCGEPAHLPHCVFILPVHFRLEFYLTLAHPSKGDVSKGNAVRWSTVCPQCVFRVSPCPVPTGWNGDWALGREEPSDSGAHAPPSSGIQPWKGTNSPLPHWSLFTSVELYSN